ncbi:aldo/keto reductase [Chitiniphilus purpureus]|uniref:aldo/keto reductase n=1 Tax=Chitiniphilus purpureus TaxID=2981137 RepID=UPI0038CBFACC
MTDRRCHVPAHHPFRPYRPDRFPPGPGRYANERGHTLLELAFSWLTAKPFVGSIIAGASTPEQVTANAQAADWQLAAAELAQIDAITAQH